MTAQLNLLPREIKSGNIQPKRTEVSRSAMALNGAFFNAQRMVLQYVRNAYLGIEP